MADTNASEAGRELVRHRWGNRVVERAAETVIMRGAELEPGTRAAVLAALGDDRHGWDGDADGT